jgi:RecJ-like exonuclease
MQFKMDGLDKLTRQLEEASRVFKSLDGEITQVTIVPGDQASVQAAIRQMEAAIDQKAAPYRGNPLVDPVVKQLKERYRDDIIKRGRG